MSINKIPLFIVAFLCVVLSFFLYANGNSQEKERREQSGQTQEETKPDPVFLAGNEAGLFSINSRTSGTALLWQEAPVKKIIRIGDFENAGISPSSGTSGISGTAGYPDEKGWYFLTGAGVVYSENLSEFETRNSGLPFKTIKNYRNGEVDFRKEIEDLKDLNTVPGHPEILVTATNKSVFLSEDAGHSWKALGRNASTDGAKTAAAAFMHNSDGTRKLTLFMSHPIYGVSYIFPHDKNPVWIDLNDGLEKVPGITYPDETASFSVSPDGSELYASQSFIPALYKLNWQEKRFEKIIRTDAFADSFDGLFVCGGKNSRRIFFTALNGLKVFTEAEGVRDESSWNAFLNLLPKTTECFYVPPEEAARITGTQGTGISFSQMWLLHPENTGGPYSRTATGKKGIYVPVWQATTEEGFNKHLDVIKKNNLNMLVIDMKDDYGFLRYDAQDPLVVEKGRTGRGIKIDRFVKKAKEEGLYLVARIVVFKDRELSRYGGGKYAVWDKSEEKPWQGYELVKKTADEEEEVKEEVKQETAGQSRNQNSNRTDASQKEKAEPQMERKYYDEFWVDPYSEEVWEYNIAIAKELITRGFDEIQFDYIRFPTDGVNLKNAFYRYQSNGMDKEDALISFLAYARREIKAPISIDIYGANGWYRTGARTGQHVEVLSKYVDVICPMFYPNHFENNFLRYEPESERPYRIYYYGTFRNTVIAKGKSFVRPWAQAFYLNVNYDKIYYNENYVQQQVFGVRDSVNLGYTYWNNSGRYTDLRPDPKDSDIYQGPSPEAAAGLPKPFYAPRTAP